MKSLWFWCHGARHVKRDEIYERFDLSVKFTVFLVNSILPACDQILISYFSPRARTVRLWMISHRVIVVTHQLSTETHWISYDIQLLFFPLLPNSPWWEELEEVEWLLEILLLLACSLSSPNQVRPFTCRFNSGQQKRRNLSLYVSLFRRHHRAVERTTPPGPGLIIENASCVHKQTKKPFSERLKFTVLVDCTVFSSRHRPEHSLELAKTANAKRVERAERYMKSRSNSFTYRKSIYDTNVVLLIYALGRF